MASGCPCRDTAVALFCMADNSRGFVTARRRTATTRAQPRLHTHVDGECVATQDNGRNWKYKCTIAEVSDDGITVKTSYGVTLESLPPASVLLVRDAGAGALLRKAAVPAAAGCGQGGDGRGAK